MNIWTFLLVIALVAFAALFIGGLSPDPIDVGRQYEIEARANAAATASAIENSKQRAISALEVDAARSTAREQVSAEKVSVWATAYTKTAVKVLMVFSLFGISISIVVASVGFSTAFVKKAHFVSTLVYPNKQMQLPSARYEILSTDGHKRVFAFDYGTKGVVMLDATNQADAQTIAAVAATRQTALLAAASVLASKNQEVNISGIDPEHITKQIEEYTYAD